MKLSGRTYRLLWDAHVWAGAVASVLLVGMFFLGIVALFHDELSPWQEPRLRAPLVATEAEWLSTLQKELDARAVVGAPRRIDIDLPSDEMPWIRFGWKEGETSRAEWIHPLTGERAEERSDLGNFLFLMHFLFPLPGGMGFTGFIASLLLLVVVSGAALQIGRFWREFIRFRPRETLRHVWGDLHKVLGSVGLPFQAMMAWTAAIICLNSVVLQPVVVHTAFDGNVDAGLESIGYPRGPKPEKIAAPAPRVDLVLQAARRALPNADHYRFSLRNLGDSSVHVDVRGLEIQGLKAFTTVRVDSKGEVLHARQAGGPSTVARVLEGAYILHSGLFSGIGLRISYALLGLFSVLCIVSGNLVWLEKRARSRRLFDLVLARLTAGGCGGVVFATAAIFLANQLLPDSMPERPSWEHATFYFAWSLSLFVALALPNPVRTTRRLFELSATILCLLPFMDAWRQSRVPLAGENAYVFWTELSLLAFGLLLFACSAAIKFVTGRSRSLPEGTPELVNAA